MWNHDHDDDVDDDDDLPEFWNTSDPDSDYWDLAEGEVVSRVTSVVDFGAPSEFHTPQYLPTDLVEVARLNQHERVAHTNFYHGEALVEVKSWYTNIDKLMEHKIFHLGVLREKRMYYANDQTEALKYYDVKGRRHGDWKYWHRNGTDQFQVTFSHGNRLRFTEWTSTGAIVRQGFAHNLWINKVDQFEREALELVHEHGTQNLPPRRPPGETHVLRQRPRCQKPTPRHRPVPGHILPREPSPIHQMDFNRFHRPTRIRPRPLDQQSRPVRTRGSP